MPSSPTPSSYSGTTAINFRQLVREERLRRQRRVLQQQQQPSQPQQEGGGGPRRDVIVVDDDVLVRPELGISEQQQPKHVQQHCDHGRRGSVIFDSDDDEKEGGSQRSASSGADAHKVLLLRAAATATAAADDDDDNEIRLDGFYDVDDAVASSLNTDDLITVCYDPPLLRYQDKFLPSSYASLLVRYLDRLPIASRYDPHQRSDISNGVWTALPHAQRSVAVFDFTAATSATTETTDRSMGLPVPIPLRPLLQSLRNLFPTDYPPNHLLINSYSVESTKGILPHTDGPVYYPLTCTISLGRSAVFRLQQPSKEDMVDVEVPPKQHLTIRLSGHGSLVTFSHDLYTKYLHSIDPWTTSTKEEDDVDGGESAVDVGTDDPKDLDLDLAEILSSRSTHPNPHHQHQRISITVRHKYRVREKSGGPTADGSSS